MKTYKDIKQFERRNSKAIDWDDYFLLNGRIFNIYEYGPGIGVNIGYDYVYFLNKRSKTMIYVKYDCPSYQYVNGEKVQTKKYRLYDIDVIEDAYLWR